LDGDREEEKSEDSIQIMDKAISVKSTVSTSRISKHCFIGKCGGNLISGDHWSRHYSKAPHRIAKEALDQSKYAICIGADCKHC